MDNYTVLITEDDVLTAFIGANSTLDGAKDRVNGVFNIEFDNYYIKEKLNATFYYGELFFGEQHFTIYIINSERDGYTLMKRVGDSGV